ncbi:MAG: S53 family peptidase [Bryobacteraceae bacterium]
MPSPKSPKRQKLPKSHKNPLKGATLIGAVNPDQAIEVTIRIRPRTSTPAGEKARASGKPLTRSQFEELFGADPADIARLEDFAHRHGLTVLQASPAERKLRLSGPASAMQAAFGTTLNNYSIGKLEYRGRVGTLSVTDDVHPLIEAVFGLDNRPQVRPHFRFHPHQGQTGKQPKGGLKPRAAGSGSFTPVEVAQLYKFPPKLDGTGQTIAIIELGGGYTNTDLKKYFSDLKVTAPSVTAVSVNGGKNAPEGDPNSADGEVMLDIEVAGAVAPGARIVVYFAPNTDSGFLDALTASIHDTVRNTNVVSISWGSRESNWTAQAMKDFDSHCADAALFGITVCVAAGDNGSTDTADASVKSANVDFPASSPNVLACGGTRLLPDGSETVWGSLSQGGGATGGGISSVFPVPAFQKNIQLPPSVNPGAEPGRGVPDIAGNADPQSGYRVLVDGQPGVVGGTSAVAPLWAALIALLNQGLGKPVGFLTPQLYQLPAGTNALKDITVGDNGGYHAGPGWDACTGLGSPNGGALLAALTPKTGSGPSKPPTKPPTKKPKPPKKRPSKAKH